MNSKLISLRIGNGKLLENVKPFGLRLKKKCSIGYFINSWL